MFNFQATHAMFDGFAASAFEVRCLKFLGSLDVGAWSFIK
jgi:hypothetical protein